MKFLIKNAGTRKNLIPAVWLGWCFLIVAIYYSQIWKTLFSLVQSRSLPQEFSGIFSEIIKACLVLLCLSFLFFVIRSLLQSSVLVKKYIIAAGVICISLLAFSSKIPHLPFFKAAVVRTALGFLGAGLVIFAANFIGYAICKISKWKFDNWRERLLSQVSVGLTFTYLLSLILTGLGLYNRTSIVVIIFSITVIGCFVLYTAYRNNKKNNEAKQSFFVVKSEQKEKLWILITIVAVVFALISALAPETEFDALSYHLFFPKVWLENGQLVDLPNRYVSLYPMSWGLIFGSGMAIGGTVAAKLLHFCCLLFGCVLVYQFVKQFFKNSSPWLAVALFITVPTVLWEASTAYVDLALAFHLCFTLYALFRYIENRKAQWLILAGLNMGMALASKHLALLALLILLAGLTLLLFARDNRLKLTLQSITFFGFVAILLPLPWYIRSYLATGNPFFPELFKIFGGPPDRWDIKTQEGLNHFFSRFGRTRTLPNLLSLPWDMTIHGFRYGGALGPAFLLMIPVLPLVLLRRANYVLPGLFFFAFAYILLWASPFSSFQMRFIVPIAPVLAILTSVGFAYVYEKCQAVSNGWKNFAYILISAILLLNLPPFTVLHERDKKDSKGWLTHVLRNMPLGVVIGTQSEQDYLRAVIPSYKAWEYINKNLSQNAFVLSFSDGDYYYSERRRLWSDATMARSLTWEGYKRSDQELLMALKQTGISHILLDKNILKNIEVTDLKIASPNFLSSHPVEYEDVNFKLYRLDY